jgi:hypothetical protein
MLSPREVRGNEGLPTPKPNESATSTQPDLVFPLKMAVAQAGEVGPGSSMFDVLRTKPDLVSGLQPIPAFYNGNSPSAPVLWLVPSTQPQPGQANFTTDQARDCRHAVDAMRGLAASLGANYLFLFGGTVDEDDNDTPLAILNLTIVGLYIFPSRFVHADAHAAGALIDVHSGRVVMLVDSRDTGHSIVPYMSASLAMDGVVDQARKNVSMSLAKRFLGQLEQIREPAKHFGNRWN